MRHDFSDDDKQDWNLPVPLLESPPHVPDMRAAPIDWISREQFLKFDTLHIVTPRLALLARNDNRRYNTWYLDSCCGHHMVGSDRYISDALSTPTMAYITVAKNTRLRASAQGIVVLKARGSRTHITVNGVLIVQNLCFNILSAAQLMDCGVDLSTDSETRDILLHYTTPNKARKQIGRAHSKNGVYILDFDIPDCSDDLQELIDLVPLRFEHIHYCDWKHPDGRPWVPHHPHPRELALHDPDPDGICRDCRAPTSSTSAIAGRGLATTAEAKREAPPEEGMSNLELEIATRGVFGTEELTLPGPALQHLQGILRGTGVCTFDAQNVPRPYTKEKLMEIYSHQRDSRKKLTVAQEEELACCEAEELRERSLTESRGTFAWSGWEEEESASNEGGHQPFPLLEPGANRYPKLHKVYHDFVNVCHCGINDKVYTLNFVDAGTRYAWIVNVEARIRAYEVFRLWLAHAQRQSGEKQKIWQSDGAAELRSKELQDYLVQKRIEHHISLPYAHQQQGVAERTNRMLMTGVDEAIEAIEASASLLDPRNAPRRAGAQLAVNHGHHRQLIAASEVNGNQG
ncbi:unnamed protein product [Closterium sp. NIES-54]